MVKQSFKLIDADILVNGNVVGGVQSVTFTTNFNTSFEHEAGSANPRAITEGPREVTGTIEKLNIDWDLLTEVMGSTFVPGQNLPEFVILGNTKNRIPERVFRLFGCKVDGTTVTTALDTSTTESIPFKALNYSIEEV